MKRLLSNITIIFILLSLPFHKISYASNAIPNDIRDAYGGSISPDPLLGAPRSEQEVFEFIPILYGAILFVGLITLLIYLLYAGIQWITAAGDPKALGGARQTATNAIIGIIVLSIAYIIGLVFQRFVFL